MRIKITTRRVRLNGDGTRTVLSESSATPLGPRTSGTAARFIGLAAMCIGVVQLALGVWGGRSDAAAATVIRASAPCQPQRLTRAIPGESPTTPGDCRIERAVVVSRTRSSTRGGMNYYLVTRTSAGTRDKTPIAAVSGLRLWNRAKPDQRLKVQRFVTPGYALSGKILAIADDESVVLARAHPDSGARPNLVNAVMGATFLLVGLAIVVRRTRSRYPGSTRTARSAR